MRIRPYNGYRLFQTECVCSVRSVPTPRGAYAPRSWWFCSAGICRRNSDFCDTQTHAYKSGGRQPTVGVTETHLQERCRKVAGDCHRCAHERRCSRGNEPTGGLRPPLLCSRTDVSRRNSDFCDTQTHVSKSGGRQPAVGRFVKGIQVKSRNVPRLSLPQPGATVVSPPGSFVRVTHGGLR